MGKETCWCFDYPNVMEIKKNECICKKCLEDKIKRLQSNDKGHRKKKT